MEIRGAGNIIGREQSGNIMDVGFDLYCQMLEDAMRSLKGEKPLHSFRTALFMKTSVFIPESYIADQKQKIEFYKRFEACTSVEEIDLLQQEMTDRFGGYPPEVSTLIELEKIRALLLHCTLMKYSKLNGVFTSNLDRNPCLTPRRCSRSSAKTKDCPLIRLTRPSSFPAAEKQLKKSWMS